MMGWVSGLGIRRSGTTVSPGRPEEVLSLVFLATMARAAFTSEQPPTQIGNSPQIAVRVYNYAKALKTTLSSAIEEARRIFQKAEVDSD